MQRRTSGQRRGIDLETAVKLWPTPSQRDYKGANGDAHFQNKERPHLSQLPNAVKAADLWPTPRANKPEGYSSENHRPTLAQQVTGEDRPKHGQLNPAWVELMMGFPLGWTDLTCEERAGHPGFPALMGEDQFAYEPARTCGKVPNRAKRLKALGNAVVPQQVFPLFLAIAKMEATK